MKGNLSFIKNFPQKNYSCFISDHTFCKNRKNCCTRSLKYVIYYTFNDLRDNRYENMKPNKKHKKEDIAKSQLPIDQSQIKFRPRIYLCPANF